MSRPGPARPADRDGAPTDGRSAIVVITKEPVAGAAKTRLIPAFGPDGAARAAAAMLADTLAVAAAAGAEPWVCFTPPGARARLARVAAGFGLLPQRAGRMFVGPSLDLVFVLGEVVPIHGDGGHVPQVGADVRVVEGNQLG